MMSISGYLRQNWKSTGGLRTIMCLVEAALFVIFVLTGSAAVPDSDSPNLALPTLCYRDNTCVGLTDREGLSLSVAGTVGTAVICLTSLICSTWKWGRVWFDSGCYGYFLLFYLFRVFFQFMVLAVSAGYSIIVIFRARGMSGVSDNSQNEWAFGQVVPVVLLASTLLALSESFRGE